MLEAIIGRGPVLGTYQSHPIHDWIVLSDGSSFDYVGVVGDGMSLRRLQGEHAVVSPGLLYKRRETKGPH